MLYIKPNIRKANKNNRISLDAKHTEMTKHFKDLHKLLPEKNNLLKELTIEYNKLLKIKKCKYTDIQLNRYFELKILIENITIEVNNISNNNEEYDYYLNTAKLLYKYYDNIDNIANKSVNIIKPSTQIKPSNNIINFINKSSNNDLSKPNTIQDSSDTVLNDMKNNNIIVSKNTDTDIKKNRKTSKIGDYIDKVYTFKSTDILDEYMQIVDSNYIPNIQFDNSIYYCSTCNIEKTIIQSEAIMICKLCGLIDYIIIDSNKPSYHDPPLEISYFAYKRINHFNEWISQFQAKESTEIPEHVYEALLSEIKKERITNMEQLTKTKVRLFLKKLKLNKYYEHIPHIINRLNGKNPPRISKEVEEKLRIMFKEIQEPFMEVCPPNRKNFLSYSYVLYKFVELLGLDQYKECFTLLKSREKLHIQDIMWRQITKKVGWAFYKSI
jgi:hypothetical protein